MAVEAGCCFTWKSPLADEACMPHNPSLFQWAHDLYQQQQRSWQYSVSFYFISGPGKGKVITLENAQKVTGVDKTRQAKVPLSFSLCLLPPLPFHFAAKTKTKRRACSSCRPKKDSFSSILHVCCDCFVLDFQTDLSLCILFFFGVLIFYVLDMFSQSLQFLLCENPRSHHLLYVLVVIQ